jgi:UDP-N-acetylmuramoylalanine--D-glutamate ligase
MRDSGMLQKTSMLDLTKIFHGSRITQMGLGLLGRGIGDAAFLARQGAELIVTDLKQKEALAASLQALAPYPSITYRLGEHDMKDFADRSLVVKGAGVPFDSPHIAHAREHGVPVDMSASLFARIADIPMVGITGTRGKSTVTHLVAHILRTAHRTVLLGGNVRGVSNLALLEALTPDATAVFELDSWQLQGFGEERSLDVEGVRQGPHSPHVAVFTTFMRDHMNYYKGDMEQYFEDKAQIFLHQGPGDILVVGRNVLEFLEPYRSRIQAQLVVADEDDIPLEWSVPLLGEHNRYNAGIAVAVARQLGLSDEEIHNGLETVTPLSGRLEPIRTIGDVVIYNDNNATTPDATAAALSALDPDVKKNIVLIAGGAEKDIPVAPLCEGIRSHAKACVLLPGSGTDLLVRSCDIQELHHVETLEDAVATARTIAHPGDRILFSPAFASFGQFANEYERNDRFVAYVHSL